MSACLRCGTRLIEQREDYKYPIEVPVVLKNVVVARCPECGEHEVSIPRIEDLQRAIARAVIDKPRRLAPAEIRFLRKHLDLTGADFARHMGTTPETVSRWESGSAPMGQVADRLLRTMVALRDQAGYPIASLKSVARTAGRPVKLQLQATSKHGWRPLAA